MQLELALGSPVEDILSGVIPDVAAMTAEPAERHIVGVGAFSLPVDEDEFVLRPIERAHAGVGFVPDAKIDQIVIDAIGGSENLLHFRPMHANVVQRSVLGMSRGMAKR